MGEMDTSKKIARHRKKCHDEQYYGPNKQEVYRPYCGKSLSTTSNMLIHMKIQPQKGEWGTETCHKLISEDTPRDIGAMNQKSWGNCSKNKRTKKRAKQQEKL